MVALSFRFGGRLVGISQPTFIIAEIGINHEGSVEAACKMVEACAIAGADAVKFQTASPDENYSPGSEEYKIYSKSFLGPEQTATVANYARTFNLEFFTTTGMTTFDWVEALNPSGYKISSGTLTHAPMVELLARSGRPLLISTGVATHEDIRNGIQVAESVGGKHIGLMQCTSLYPCPDKHVDLASIKWMFEKFGKPCGFSDHTKDSATAPFAVAAGAVFIEKHFSLTPEREGFDHHLSLDPEGFREMVDGIRRVEVLLGASDKPLRAVDAAGRMQRFIVAKTDIEAGSIITESCLKFIRQSSKKGAFVPMEYKNLIGGTAKVKIKENQIISHDIVDLVHLNKS
jgi:sialic acid synthase SpsE